MLNSKSAKLKCSIENSNFLWSLLWSSELLLLTTDSVWQKLLHFKRALHRYLVWFARLKGLTAKAQTSLSSLIKTFCCTVTYSKYPVNLQLVTDKWLQCCFCFFSFFFQPAKGIEIFLISQQIHFQWIHNIWAASSTKKKKKKKNAFKHSQRVRIHILHMCNLIWAFVTTETLYSIQWFCLRTAKALIRLHICAVWSGPSLSAHDQKVHFCLVG